MKIIQQFLEKNKKKKVTVDVVGDSMIDEYYNVKVTRISPESPSVCVMLSDSDQANEVLPGGAANVCYQLNNFNVRARLFTWLDDEAKVIFESCGVPSMSALLPKGLKISRKKRFYDGESQVGDRWDIEKKNYGLNEEGIVNMQANLESGFSMSGSADVVIYSDYNKGIFNGGFRYHTNIPKIVDPKDPPLIKWRGCCDIFKPNHTEAYKLSDGLTDWRQQCDYFQEKLGCHSVVITRNGKGVAGKSGGNYFEHHPVDYVYAHKTSGAGDTFVALLGAAVAHGFSVKDSAAIAFEAGSLFVQQKNRRPITPWQLQRQSKFISPEDLENRDYKLVFTNGCFDVLHSGHLESLRFAKSKGDKLLVAVNSDDSVRRFKGESRPVMSLQERMEMLAALEIVDYVVSFEDDSPYDLIEQIIPEVLVKGADWKGKGGAVGSELVKETYFVPLVEDKSTTNIIDKIKELA